MSSPVRQPGFFTRLRARLNSGNSFLTRDLAELFPGGKLDEDSLEDIETRLLMADVGVPATQHIVAALQEKLRRAGDPLHALQESMLEILAPHARPLDIGTGPRPFVLLVVGVNGAGKTTTIGKLAARYRHEGRSVMLAAGDTFRAAAVEQLQAWGDRHEVPVIAQGTGADSAAVAHDALQAAMARDIDVLIVDTAGRLHTQRNLMDELAKVKRVLGRQREGAPDETLLVLDGGTGQNALVQARQFHEALGVTGLAVTKLDGTARGGVLFAICEELGLPIRYIGVGESSDDLQPFVAEEFTAALLNRDAA